MYMYIGSSFVCFYKFAFFPSKLGSYNVSQTEDHKFNSV